jgi:hypothetical protein
MLHPIRAARLGLLSLLSLVALVSLAPDAARAGRPRFPNPQLVVTSPANGTFSNAASVTVTGQARYVNPSTAVVTVNGVVVPLNSNGTFSYELTLNPSIVFNPIETRIVSPQFKIDRRVVIAGESVADGDFSYESLGLRLNDSALDAMEPIVTSLVDLDLATLVPAGTQVIDEYCILTIFVCVQSADAFIYHDPPPSIGSFGIDIDSQVNAAFGDILLNDLFIKVRVVKGSAGVIGFTCYLTVTADTTDILGDFALEPMEGAENFVDVTQTGPADVVFGGFADSTDCSGIFGGVLEFFIDLVVGDIQDLMEPAFEDFLNAVDMAGNTAVAGAIETALSEISIGGPIGESLNVELIAPFFAVTEDDAGITLGSDAAILSSIGNGPGQCPPPPPGTPELSASYHIPEAFPGFPATTPVGGLPYDLGIAISTSAFNQLLKAQVECGLLQTDIAEFEFLGNVLPLTAGLLGALLPEFNGFNPALPLIARLQPTTAPVLTGNAGPNGEATEMRIGQLAVDLRDNPAFGGTVSYLKLAVDVRIGLDFDFVGGELTPQISAVAPGDIQVSVISSYFPTITPQDVQGVLPGVLAGALPELSGTLGSFPIPSFFGFGLDPVEVGTNGEFLGIYANLVPPAP